MQAAVPIKLPEFLQYMVAVGPLLSGLGTATAAIVAIRAYINARTQRDVQEKTAVGSTLQWCGTSYQNVRDLHDKAQASADQADGVLYFRRLWDLHYIQYQLYLRGLIPKKVYALWLWVRNRAMTQNDKVGGVDERTGWLSAAAYIGDNEFKAFIDRILAELTREGIEKHFPEV